MRNNKGVSAVVATVLIILITVAAVTIIWAAVVPMIRDQLDEGAACLDITSVEVLPSEYTCVNTDGSLSVNIKRGADDYDLIDVELYIYGGGQSKAIKANATSLGTVPNPNEERVYTISNATAAGYTDSVSVAPVIKSGNSETTCGASEMVMIEAC